MDDTVGIRSAEEVAVSARQAISSYDTEALSSYIARVGGQPQKEAAELKSKSVGGVQRRSQFLAYRRHDRVRRVVAAWRWLDPGSRLSVGDLRVLQEQSGLEMLSSAIFAAQLAQDCFELISVHPCLRLWGLRRIGLLESVFLPSRRLAAELADIGVALRRELLIASRMAGQASTRLSVNTARICSIALAASAHAVADIFRDGSSCQVSANLMLTGRHWAVPREHSSMATIQANQRRATALWEGFDDFEETLVVVAETTEASHVGFWVPAPVDDGGDTLIPGATTAFRRSQGSTVFRDDLPPLGVLPDAVKTAWYRYMQYQFQDDMFISLPLQAPMTDVGLRRAIAVVNVNVKMSDDRGWRRAYQQEWLERASERASEFAEIAYWAYVLFSFASPEKAFLRQTDHPRWDILSASADAE
jgi:hypothetical protein